MERCDFASICAVIRRYLLEGAFDSQTDFLETLFDGYIQENDVTFDNGLVNKWLNGVNRLSPGIRKFYQKQSSHEPLKITLLDAVIPSLSDSGMVVQEVYNLLIQDATVSASKKTVLCTHYPCETGEDEAEFLADALAYGMIRDFYPHDIRKPCLPPSGNLSPVLKDYVFDEGLPKPCRYFCGRERELETLHQLLVDRDKVFLRGIPGIGKSEIAKAYAKERRKDYTNILFLTYSGDLKRDIANLSFTDDFDPEDDSERFRRHNRFLRTLKTDTLIIIDNFNAAPAEDDFLPVLLKYRCRILITTRGNFTGWDSLLIEEFANKDALFQLAAACYSGAERYRSVLESIMETVHYHTFAVELAARLLESGIFNPREVLEKMERELASFNAADRISVSKDGRTCRATYYEHIHALFGLFRLSSEKRNIMRSLALIPPNGIHKRLFGMWMKFDDLNAVNELSDAGMISSLPGNRVVLHPMVRDVVISELPPSLTNCRTMLDSIIDVCKNQGKGVVYNKMMFQVIENTVSAANKDDDIFYLLLIRESLHYMKKYDYRRGMILLLNEIERMIKQGKEVSSTDRTLLIFYRAYCVDSERESIRLLEDAVKSLPEIDDENSAMASGIHFNLGIKYLESREYILGIQHIETALSITSTREYQLIGGYDSIVQFINYAIIMHDLGRPQSGLSALRSLEQADVIRNEITAEHAMLLKLIGFLFLCVGDQKQAMDSIRKSLAIYEKIYEDDPELLNEEHDEIAVVCQAVQETGQLPRNWAPSI